MTPRERWIRTMRFQSVDHVPDEEFGYWDNTFTIWHSQGLPKEINNNGNDTCLASDLENNECSTVHSSTERYYFLSLIW